jgi:hypothetical protein
MKKLIVVSVVITLGLLVGNAVADEIYTCTQGDQERIITIVYQDQAAKVPCEVQYQKNGVTETLWNAQNEVGYCESKAQEFVEKQSGWGWDCAMAGAAMADDGTMQDEMTKEGAQDEMMKDMKEESK